MTQIILSNYVDACTTLAREFCNHMGYDYDDGYWVAPTYSAHTSYCGGVPKYRRYVYDTRV